MRVLTYGAQSGRGPANSLILKPLAAGSLTGVTRADEKSRVACCRWEAHPGAFFPAALFPGLAKSHESASWRSVFKARPLPSLAGSSKPASLWFGLGESVKGFLFCFSMGTSLGAAQRGTVGVGGHLRLGHLGGRWEGARPGGWGGAELRAQGQAWEALETGKVSGNKN